MPVRQQISRKSLAHMAEADDPDAQCRK